MYKVGGEGGDEEGEGRERGRERWWEDKEVY